MKQRPASILPVSPWLALGVVLACGLVAYFLIPNERLLIERLMRDGFTDRALEALRKIPPQVRSADAAFYDLAELRLTREQLTAAERQAGAPQIERAASAYVRLGFRSEYLVELNQWLGITDAPAEAFQSLRPLLSKMPVSAQRLITAKLVEKALAEDLPAIGAQIQEHFWRQVQGDPDATAELVRLSRFSDQPGRALEAIETWRARDPSAGTRTNLLRLRIELLRELGKSNESYAAIRELVNPENLPEEMADLFIALAAESDHARDVLPLLRRRAEAAPGDHVAWQRYGDLAVASGEMEEGIQAYDRVLRLRGTEGPLWYKFAQFHEWSDQPGLAFDYYRKALRYRSTNAIERLIELNESLYRDADLAEAFEENAELLREDRFKLAAARVHARLADFDTARRFYAALLESPGARPEWVLEYARLLMALFEYDAALPWLNKSAGQQPDNLSIQKLLAEVYTRLGDYDRALRVYAGMLRREIDDESVTLFINLAESLGRGHEVVDGLRRKIESGDSVTARDYQRLAHFLNLLGRRGEYVKTLQEGLKRFPERTDIRIAIAYALGEQKEFLAAAAVLEASPELRTSSECIQLYASYLVQAQKFNEADVFLKSGLPDAALQSTMVIECRAQIAESNSELAKASGFYKELHTRDPANRNFALNYARSLSALGEAKQAEKILKHWLDSTDPEVFHLAAQIYVASGDYKSAEGWQRRFIASNPREAAQAWGFLGDILLSRGDKVNSKHAYRKALDAMLAPPREGARR